MFRNQSRAWLGGLFLLLAFVPTAAGQEAASALALVPAETPVVIHVRGFERTKDRLLTLAKNALPDLGEMLKTKIDEAMKEALEDRKIEGLPKDGSIIAVLTEMPKPGQEEPIGAVIFAVTDFTKFRDGYLTDDEKKTIKADAAAGYQSVMVRGKEVFLVDRKGYAVLTLQKETAAKFTGKYAGIDGKLPKETSKRLLESDAAVYVDMTAVNKEYGDQIKAFRPLIDFAMQQAAAQADKAQIEMAKAFINGIFQFVEDSRGFLASVDFRPEGLAMHVQGRVGADTKINGFLKSAKTAPLTDIETLPVGKMTYTAAILDGEMLKMIGPFLQGMSAEGPQATVVADLYNQLAAAEPQGMIANYNMPVEGVQIWKFKDPGKATDAYAKMFQGLIKGEMYSNVPIKDKPTLKKDAQTHRGFKLHSVSFQFDFEKLAEKMPQGGKEMADVMKTMMGEGTNSWFGTDGKVFVQITAKDWPAAQKQLDDYVDGKNTIGKQPGFQDALKQLPSPRTLITLIDGPVYIQVMVGVFGAMFKGQGAPIELPEYKGTPGKIYFGIAMALQPELGGFDLWIPATIAAEIRKIVEPIVGGGVIQ